MTAHCLSEGSAPKPGTTRVQPPTNTHTHTHTHAQARYGRPPRTSASLAARRWPCRRRTALLNSASTWDAGSPSSASTCFANGGGLGVGVRGGRVMCVRIVLKRQHLGGRQPQLRLHLLAQREGSCTAVKWC